LAGTLYDVVILGRWKVNKVVAPAGTHTREDGGFEQLHELIDLDEHVDGHFEFRTMQISGGSFI
jgi:hypothetical protein